MSEKKKIGFSLGGAKKRKLPVIKSQEKDETKKEKKDFITGMSGSKVESAEGEETKVTLVIPLSLNPWGDNNPENKKDEQNKPPNTQAGSGEPQAKKAKTEGSELTEDEAAAKELLNDIKDQPESTSNSNLVIAGVSAAKPTKAQPLLLASLPPGIMELDNDDDRFAFDVKMRPEDMDVKSDAYKLVPIEEFGAAMLRGMGWSGPGKEETDLVNKTASVQPRHHRLGLGAQPKPPEEKKKKRIKRPGEKDRDVDVKKLWAEKVKAANAEKRRQQKKTGSSSVRLYDQDIVKVVEGEHKRTRAVITQCQGVPGLNCLRLELETTGEEVIISKKTVKLVKEEDLKEKPFVYGQSQAKDTKTRFLGLEDDDPRNQDDSKKDKKRDKDDRDKDRNRDRDRDRKKDKKDKKDKAERKSSSSSSSSKKTQPNWVTSHIRVRVISEKVGKGRFYGKKGVVQDVISLGICDVRMDSGDLLEQVKQSWLDTALPKPGGRVMVVRGGMRNSVGTLLERNKAKENVVVQFEQGVETLGMDDIAEFTGSSEDLGL